MLRGEEEGRRFGREQSGTNLKFYVNYILVFFLNKTNSIIPIAQPIFPMLAHVSKVVSRPCTLGRTRALRFASIHAIRSSRQYTTIHNQHSTNQNTTTHVMSTSPLPKIQVRTIRQLREGQETIYVSNVPFNVTVEDLRNEFSQFGAVHFVHIPRNRDTGRARGIAFVTMDQTAVQAAIDGLSGKEIAGRNITCSVAKKREDDLGGNTQEQI